VVAGREIPIHGAIQPAENVDSPRARSNQQKANRNLQKQAKRNAKKKAQNKSTESFVTY
jgi:F0F1-type ATP synthase epsilon subunit